MKGIRKKHGEVNYKKHYASFIQATLSANALVAKLIILRMLALIK
jgi:hypothetical protein